jgi:hypothetical protein
MTIGITVLLGAVVEQQVMLDGLLLLLADTLNSPASQLNALPSA